MKCEKCGAKLLANGECGNSFCSESHFIHACGETICLDCGKQYKEHRQGMFPWLLKLCNGTYIKI